MKLLKVTCVSATIELINDDVYYSSNSFDVVLNGNVVIKSENRNVFTLYDLKPDTAYEVKVNEKTLSFKTEKVSEIYNIYPTNTNNDSINIQNVIDKAKDNSLVIINDGSYNITPLYIKDNITIYLKEDARLLASTNVDDYKEIDSYYYLRDNKKAVLGTWEGLPCKMKQSIINFIDVNNSTIVGKGIIDGQASNSNWWDNPRRKPYVRPHLIYINNSRNINLIGLQLFNSPQWTVHPFFSNNVCIYNLDINNPKISPNTDGINPQCCNMVDIIGVKFSVGDDCIAIKSGKIDLANEFKTPSENITIRNCLMQFGHGGIVLGSEMSGGIRNLNCERCFFYKTDRGLRIKTRRGRGKLAVIDGVTFNNIKMDNVLTPLVINMFYYCDPDGKTKYVYTKEKLKVDDRTPTLGKFTFNNIEATNCEYCVAYFDGLPEMPIKEININHSSFLFKENASKGKPSMKSYSKPISKKGFYFKNVENININDVKVEGYIGKLYNIEGNSKITKK